MTAPTVVVVSHICPFPATAGIRRRIGQLLHWLKREGYQVVFVMQPLDVEEPGHLQETRALVDELIVVPRRMGKERWRWWARTAVLWPFKVLIPASWRRTLRGAPASDESTGPAPNEFLYFGDIDSACWPSTVQITAQVVERVRPVAVLCEYVTMSLCLEGLAAGPLKVIDTCEVYHRNHDIFLRERIGSGFTCTPEMERRGLLRADVLLGIQENDSQALRRLVPELPVHTVGYANPVVGASRREPIPGRLLYVGSSNHFNRQSLERFLAEGWRHIRAACPTAALHIVGNFPELAAEGPMGVRFLGRISDESLALEYAAAEVVLNPQVAGTGLKIKCIEAMANGCALVVRRAGADGLEAGAGTAFLLAEDWRQFAASVVSLLKDETRRRALEAGALAFVRTHFSEAVVFQSLKSVLGEQTRKARGNLAA